MSPLEPLAVGGALVLVATYLLHSTLVLSAVWVLQLRAGARLRDWLWKAAFLLPLITTGAHALSIAPSFAPSWNVPLLADSFTSVASDGESTAAAGVSARRVGSGTPSIAAPLAARSSAQLDSAKQAFPSPTKGAQPGSSITALGFMDAVAAAFLAMALLIPSLRLRHFLRPARAIRSGALFDELQSLQRSAGMLRAVHLYEHDALGSPVAAGSLRRAIYLPSRVHALEPSSQRALLAHELAHHARLDPLWNRITHLASFVLFFQPLHRVARAHTIASAELLADDLAVRWTGDGPGLARCLTEVAAWVKPAPRVSMAVAMVRTTKPRALRTRIHRALDAPREMSALFSVPAALALSAAAWCMVPSIASGPSIQEPRAKADPASPYYASLRSLELLLTGVTPSNETADELRALQAELNELTRAAAAATSQE